MNTSFSPIRNRTQPLIRFVSTVFLVAILLGGALQAQTANGGMREERSPAIGHQALLQANARIIAAVSSGAAANAQTKAVLAARHDLVENVLRNEPANARSYALDPAIRAALLAADASTAALIEKDAALTGELVGSVADDFEHRTATKRHTLHTFTKDIDLSFAAAIPGIEHKLHRQVTVHGMSLPNVMAAESLAEATPAELEQNASVRNAAGGAAPSTPAPATCSTTGVQRIAVLIVHFPNNTPAFPTGLDQAAYWNNVLFGGNPSVNSFWNEVSYNQTSATGDIYGPFTLSQSYDCSNTSGLQTAAIAAAAGTVDFTQYNRIVIVFPVTSCYFGGLATVGCQSASSTINHEYAVVWLPIFNWYKTDDVSPQIWGSAAHELGHTLGLNHANSLDFGLSSLGPLDFVASNPGTIHPAPPAPEEADAAGSPAPVAAVNTEYGDYFAAMGYPWVDAGPYSAEHRAKLLGWISKTDERDITASGTYTLVPAENSSGLRALRVLRDSTSSSWLWLEFHQPTGYYTPNNMSGNPGNTLTGGAQIHYENGFGDPLYTYLLDMTPVAISNNFLDGTLAPGKSWSDPYSLLTLTAGTEASSSLGVTVSYDTPCATLTLSPSVLAAAGGTANLTITAPSTCSWSVSSNASWISFPGTTSGNGSATVSFAYTANATSAQRNSYITAQRQSLPLVQNGTALTITGLTPNAGSSAINAAIPFTLSLNDALGLADVSQVNFILTHFGITPDCEVEVVFSGSRAYLYLYANGSYGSSILAGGTGSLASPSCSISGPGSSYVISGKSATITMALSFPSSFTGTSSISASANSISAGSTASIPLGYWIVSPPQPIAQTITFTPPASPVTYGISPITLSATGGGSGNPVTFSLVSGPGSLNGANNSVLTIMGAGTVVVAANQAGNANYAAAAQVTQSVIVTPAPLTVTANNASRAYGASNPAFGYVITGFVNGDTSAVVSGTASLTTAATVSSQVGTYPITFATESLTASNYSFTYFNGTLVVYSASSSMPLPMLLSPGSATATGAGFTLTVFGEGFASNSRVLWNGAVRTTTYVSGTQLTAVINAADIAKEATNLVTVVNFSPNPGTSSAQPFAVISATPVAAINGSTIAVAADGGGNHVLTLTGTDFIAGSEVQWIGTGLTTNYVSPWQISATITAGDFTTRPAMVTVKNPAGTSAGSELP